MGHNNRRNIPTPTSYNNPANELIQERAGELTNHDKETEINLKKTFGSWVRIVTNAYLIFAAFIIVIELVIRFFTDKTGLSDMIIITLLGTTTISIVGLPLAIAKPLFSK